MLSITTHLSMLHGRSIHFLKAHGFVNPEQVKSKALYRLAGRLLHFSEVRVVAVHGFAHSRDAGASETAVDIQVMTSKPPTRSLQDDIDKILFDINCRYDVRMKVVVECQEPEVPASRTIRSS